MSHRPIAALLAVRRRAEEEARAALGHAIAAESDAARRHEALGRRACAHAERCAEARLRQVLAPGSVGGLQLSSRFVERLRGEGRVIDVDVRASEDALRRAREEVDRLVELLAAARQGVRALERHGERWDEARRRDLRRRAERDADDAVSASAAAR